MRNKKAILMPEVMKILIAVLCIAALIYLAVSISGLATKKAKVEQSKGTLDEIEAKIKTLIDSKEEKSFMMTVLAPNEWYIVSFTKSDIERPKLCPGDCLCVCEDYDAAGCDGGKGLCRKMEKAVSIAGEKKYIYIDKAFDMDISKVDKIILLRRTT